MTDGLEYLTEEERKTVLEIFPKKLESTDDGQKPIQQDKDESPEVDTSKVLDKRSEEQKQDWKDGYTDYEKKTKDSDRLSYQDSEIEIIEEEF